MGYLSEEQKRKRSESLGLNGKVTLSSYTASLSLAKFKVKCIADELNKYKGYDDSHEVIIRQLPDGGNKVTKTVGYIRLELKVAEDELKKIIKFKDSGKVMTKEEEIAWELKISEKFKKLRNGEGK